LEQYTTNSRKGAYSDIYSLGAVFYFALTGQKPIDAATRMIESLPEPQALLPEIPNAANRTILKAIQLQPESRYQTVQKFMEDLLNIDMQPSIRSPKRQRRYLWFLIGYILFFPLFWLGTQKHIEDKETKLRKNAYDYFNNFFRHQDIYIDTYYSDQKIKYTQSTNPEKKPNSSLLNEWSEKFSDIYKFFKIDNNFNGWQLFVAQRIMENTICTYNIYPSYVGYKRQENQYMYNWIPSVPDCVEEAYDFWVNNTKSQYIEYYKKGNKHSVEDFISDFGNEYYYLQKKIDKQPIVLGIGTAGWMYNGFYKVFAERLNYTYYEIVKNERAIEENKIKILTTGIGLAIAFALIIILIYWFIIIQKNN
jgi:serine/threonine protein kinase